MSERAFGLLLICALVLLLFLNWSVAEQKRSDREEVILYNLRQLYESQTGQRGKVVFARSRVPEGTLLTKDLLEERKIPINKIPGQSMTETSDVLGRTARFGIAQGEIVSSYDLDPYPPGLSVQAVKCVKRIPAGSPIKDDAVELTQLFSDDLTESTVLNVAKVLGRKARCDIEVGQLLRTDQVEPRQFESLTIERANKPYN